METIQLDNDITVFYIAATSFPDGILEAHQKLHSLIPLTTERKYFGLSRPERNTIVYMAAASELEPGEAERFGLGTVTLRKGRYLCITVKDFMKDVPSIGHAFELLLQQPGLDPQGYCVEWYFTDDDVKCMIRLEEK